MCKKITLYGLLLLTLPLIGFGQYTKLFDFGNGGWPYGSLISDGTFLYGMSNQGPYGNIFKIMPNGTGYASLHSFSTFPSDGSLPDGSLYYDGTYLYGMTTSGGGTICCTGGAGNIFKILTNGTNYTDLHDCSLTNGAVPVGSLISDGTYLYGMTSEGGTSTSCSTQHCGVIFKIKPNGTGYDTLLNFRGANGANPYGTLIYDGTYLYGMAKNGGINDSGLVFKIKPDGSGYDTLINFNGANGANPFGSLIYDSAYLYGMTYSGGSNHFGTIFKIMPNGTNYVKLLDFAGSANGKNPYGDLVSDGTWLYGTTKLGGTVNQGIIFKIMLDGTGYDTLHVFGRGTDGKNPLYGTLLLSGGCLYGMTELGGTNSSGTVFSFCLAGAGVQKNGIQNSEFRIYPNPANEIINLTISQFENFKMYRIEIDNLVGECIYRQIATASNCQINIADLSNGVYFISIETETSKTVKKIIKN